LFGLVIRMIFNLQLTLRCNLYCSYCQATAEGSPFPPRLDYSIATLRKFIKQDSHPIIAFYGGEPLLEIPLMQEIMDTIDVDCYILQTNGLLLHKLPAKYTNRFHTIVMSIDGREDITDFHRGKGTHRKVIQNAKLIRQNGFRGELIARMTVTEEMNIYPEATWLLELENPRFDSIHWQLDMMFNDRTQWKALDEWISNTYNPQISKLIDDWVTTMKKEALVLKIYPFLGVIDRLLFTKSHKLHCGAGWIWQNICTDGNITACPVGADFQEFHVGNIKDTAPSDTYDALLIGDPCPQCEIFEICGGRCLYANLFKPWGEDGYRLVCMTVFHLVNELRKVQSVIQELLSSNKLKREDFTYFKYNCCEIIP